MSNLLQRFTRSLKTTAVLGAAAISFLGISNDVRAQDGAPVLTITTGKDNGTYYLFAEQIREMLPPGLDLRIEPSDGSVQNLRRLLGYEGQNDNKFYQLALVQSDVLDQLRARAKGDDVLESIVERIKVVLPLYNEEIHVFALSEQKVRGLDDIVARGLSVNADDEKSGTNLTARWLFDRRGQIDMTLNWFNADYSEGLPGLGIDYDVGFYVAGAPSTLGKSITNESNVTLVSIDVPDLYESPNSPYVPVEITTDTYPWLDQNVRTVGVRALLVAFDYDEKNPYCGQIADLTRAVLDKYENLVRERAVHRKWGELDPVAAKNRTDLYRCSEPVLKSR